jgi:glucan phosphoethanolaminetransferase (alkaline phosphatase superfamily)
VHIEPSIFEGIFDTNFDEVKRLGSSKPIFIFLIILLYLIVIIEFSWFKTFTFKKRVKVHLFKVVILIGLLVSYGVYRDNLHLKSLTKFVQTVYPVSFINSFYKATKARYKLYKMNKSKIDIVKKYNFTRDKDANFIVVFVRGESLRARSFPITDKNIPLQYRLDDLNNTVFYDNVYSYANYTQAAVPWMLTRSVDDKLQNEKSLISVVRDVGFDTTWIGCDHSNLANFATPIVNYSLEANRSLFLGKLHDWQINNQILGKLHDCQINNQNKKLKENNRFPQQKYFNEVVGSNSHDGLQFSYILSKINSSIDKKNYFFWLEMNGSHVPWTTLVPEKFRLYKPFCSKVIDEIKECSEKEAKNAYNNTILYTQYLLKKLILSLEHKNAIVFFASDHGESTGESGYYGHGFMLPEDKRKIRDQINPAFMIWMSDKFRKQHKKEYEALKNNSEKTMKHNILFHSILDILGIKSSIIDKRNSIFRDEFIGMQKKN